MNMFGPNLEADLLKIIRRGSWSRVLDAIMTLWDSEYPEDESGVYSYLEEAAKRAEEVE